VPNQINLSHGPNKDLLVRDSYWGNCKKCSSISFLSFH